MSEASCYTLDVYCDNTDFAPFGSSQYGGMDQNTKHSFLEFPHQYTGETRGECVRKARRDGWVFHRDGRHSCPACNSVEREE